MGYAFVDTDLLIQEREGETLQAVVDRLGQDAFRQLEEATICGLQMERTVIATGGSVVYYPAAMAHLATLGPNIWLQLPFAEVERRVALFPDRGLAIAPGQTLHDLFAERTPLYQRYATHTIEGNRQPEIVVEAIKRKLTD